MPWTLEIHHIDVQTGDATLIIAKDSTTPANNRATLIDGGKMIQGPDLFTYIDQRVQELNVMIASHYDQDHIGGLIFLLKKSGTTKFDRTVVIDRGEEGLVDNRGNTGEQREAAYMRYLNAIDLDLKAGRSRPTKEIITKYNTAAAIPQGWKAPSTLVNQEVLWRNNDPDAVNNGNPIPLGDPITIPVGAPTITCIAANCYLLNDQNAVILKDDGSGDLENRLSLAFKIKFNNFIYFTAGDIESPQEAIIAQHLNPTFRLGQSAGSSISAFKVSHHGSANSTARGFIYRLGAKAAFVSVGQIAKFQNTTLPTARVINDLQAVATLRNYFLTDCGYPMKYIVSAKTSQQAGKSRVAGGDSKRIVRGGKNIRRELPKKGHIVLTVNENGSTNNTPNFDVSYWYSYGNVKDIIQY